MTDERDDAKQGTVVSVAGPPAARVPAPPLTRRALIRSASAAAIPTILTLNSGSAIAAAMTSAALITPSDKPEGTNYLCISEVTPDPTTGKYIVNPPIVDGDITVIDGTQTYYFDKNASPGNQATPLEMCANKNGDSEYWYKQDGRGDFIRKPVPKGIVASCDAIRSFGSVSACSGDV